MIAMNDIFSAFHKDYNSTQPQDLIVHNEDAGDFESGYSMGVEAGLLGARLCIIKALLPLLDNSVIVLVPSDDTDDAWYVKTAHNANVVRCWQADRPNVQVLAELPRGLAQVIIGQVDDMIETQMSNMTLVEAFLVSHESEAYA